MGIQAEFNPDLALRSHDHFLQGERKQEECLPEALEEGKTYPFLKKGQRLYFLKHAIPLLETKGNEQLSRPVASITILSATHFVENGETYTKGTFLVHKVFDPNDNKIHFESYAPL